MDKAVKREITEYLRSPSCETLTDLLRSDITDAQLINLMTQPGVYQVDYVDIIGEIRPFIISWDLYITNACVSGYALERMLDSGELRTMNPYALSHIYGYFKYDPIVGNLDRVHRILTQIDDWDLPEDDWEVRHMKYGLKCFINDDEWDELGINSSEYTIVKFREDLANDYRKRFQQEPFEKEFSPYEYRGIFVDLNGMDSYKDRWEYLQYFPYYQGIVDPTLLKNI